MHKNRFPIPAHSGGINTRCRHKSTHIYTNTQIQSWLHQCTKTDPPYQPSLAVLTSGAATNPSTSTPTHKSKPGFTNTQKQIPHTSPLWRYSHRVPPQIQAHLHQHTNASLASPIHKTRSPIPAHSGGINIRCCLLYTSPSPRDGLLSRMPSSA